MQISKAILIVEFTGSQHIDVVASASSRGEKFWPRAQCRNPKDARSLIFLTAGCASPRGPDLSGGMLMSGGLHDQFVGDGLQRRQH
jgi:hypothetical protein